jgi:hypothetical protein
LADSGLKRRPAAKRGPGVSDRSNWRESDSRKTRVDPRPALNVDNCIAGPGQARAALLAQLHESAHHTAAELCVGRILLTCHPLPKLARPIQTHERELRPDNLECRLEVPDQHAALPTQLADARSQVRHAITSNKPSLE